jgi:uncharacterized protein DUF4189
MRRLSVLLACVVMALTLIAITVASGASAAPKQQVTPWTHNLPSNYYYGAVDWSQAKATLYVGYGPSKASANQAAYNRCRKNGATDCVTKVWVYNGYLAEAESSKWVGFGWGRTWPQARDTALKNCQGAGAPPCKIGWFSQTALDPNKETSGGYTLPGP